MSGDAAPVTVPAAIRDAPAPPAAICTNCGAALRGPFCAMCGQAVRPLDPPIGHFAKEFTQELLDVDNRVLRSMRRLFFRRDS